jgi:hypothetical protein
LKLTPPIRIVLQKLTVAELAKGFPAALGTGTFIFVFTRSCHQPIAQLATFFHSGFLLGLLFDPENGDDMLVRNVG